MVSFWYGYEYDTATDQWSVLLNYTSETFLQRDHVLASIRTYTTSDGFQPEILRDSEHEIVAHPVWWVPNKVLVYRKCEFPGPTDLPTPAPQPVATVEQFVVGSIADVERARNYIGSQIALGADHIFLDVVLPLDGLPDEIFQAGWQIANGHKGRSKYRWKIDDVFGGGNRTQRIRAHKK